MTRLDLSYKMSAEMSQLVKKRYLEDSYGLKSCTDPMIEGDLYDKYLLKLFILSDFDCFDLFDYE